MTTEFKDDVLGLKSKLELVEMQFQEKLKVMEEKEATFKVIDEKIQDIISKDTSLSIKLNIGGKIFNTKLSTLLSVKDTVFYRIIGDYVKNEKQLPEALFFDRSYDHFELILNFLRFKEFSLKKFSKFEKEDIKEEIEYYGLSDILNVSKKSEIEIEWDEVNSKSGVFNIDKEDRKKINIHSNTCYTHFLANKRFKDEDFQIDLEVNITQSDNYLYVGMMNESYSLTGSCGCCNPSNCCYIQCDGSIHCNSSRTDNYDLAWNSQKILIQMKVYLSDPSAKRMYFIFPEKNDLEKGPFNITGNDFRLYIGHCNSGNGSATILECFELK